MHNIFRKGRSTNFKLGTLMENENLLQLQARWPSRVICQGRKVTWRTRQILADKLSTKRRRNTKIGANVVHPPGNNAHQFQGQRSKVKVTRPTNAHAVHMQYLPSGKVYELQGWYTDGAWILVAATNAVTFKVNGQGRKVTWRVWQVLADKSRTIRRRNTKIGGKVVHLTGNNAHQFQGQRSKVKVTSLTNAHTVNVQYLPNGKVC